MHQSTASVLAEVAGLDICNAADKALASIHYNLLVDKTSAIAPAALPGTLYDTSVAPSSVAM
jgi:hypothetical protein